MERLNSKKKEEEVDDLSRIRSSDWSLPRRRPSVKTQEYYLKLQVRKHRGIVGHGPNTVKFSVKLKYHYIHLGCQLT